MVLKPFPTTPSWHKHHCSWWRWWLGGGVVVLLYMSGEVSCREMPQQSTGQRVNCQAMRRLSGSKRAGGRGAWSDRLINGGSGGGVDLQLRCASFILSNVKKEEAKSLREAEGKETKGHGAEEHRETGWCHRELMDRCEWQANRQVYGSPVSPVMAQGCSLYSGSCHSSIAQMTSHCSRGRAAMGWESMSSFLFSSPSRRCLAR